MSESCKCMNTLALLILKERVNILPTRLDGLGCSQEKENRNDERLVLAMQRLPHVVEHGRCCARPHREDKITQGENYSRIVEISDYHAARCKLIIVTKNMRG